MASVGAHRPQGVEGAGVALRRRGPAGRSASLMLVAAAGAGARSGASPGDLGPQGGRAATAGGRLEGPGRLGGPLDPGQGLGRRDPPGPAPGR